MEMKARGARIIPSLKKTMKKSKSYPTIISKCPKAYPKSYRLYPLSFRYSYSRITWHLKEATTQTCLETWPSPSRSSKFPLLYFPSLKFIYVKKNCSALVFGESFGEDRLGKTHRQPDQARYSAFAKSDQGDA